VASPYLLAIRGQLVITGYEPDGDSIRFIADTPTLFSQLQRGYKIRKSARDGSVQLRLEAIDAPELHYGNAAQPDGATARDWLLDQLGFHDITYKPNTTVTAATPPAIPAVIYTKASDTNGRPVSYLHAHPSSSPKDGTWTHVTTATLDRTSNAQALTDGLAYPTFYTSTPAAHVTHLRALAAAARDAKAGIWATDQTSLFQLIDQTSIGPQGQLILPKLFRRATDYLKDVAKGFTGNLTDWLLANATGTRQENDTVVLPGGIETPLSALLDQRNNSVAFNPTCSTSPSSRSDREIDFFPSLLPPPTTPPPGSRPTACTEGQRCRPDRPDGPTDHRRPGRRRRPTP
jgi:endonuclease YncB( thermonuclease family)